MLDPEVKKDLEFLLNFAPAVDPAEVEPGLVGVCYITGKYEGDVKLVERVKQIVELYDLHIPDEDIADV